jgi:16S rRNA (adenine1518-N6/adenine1519-N6)-dimethyltransferase
VGRRLGQHFLRSQSILDRIARAALPADANELVIEIGPGRGALTDHLLKRASRVVAIEVDPVLIAYLRQKYQEQPVEIIDGDVLKTDLAQWGPAPVAGNLPYYITSPIFERVLSVEPPPPHTVFLIQKEVAERVVAKPGSREYGYLSVMCQLRAHCELLFTVAPGHFSPPPKVDSAVLRFTPRATNVDVAGFLKFASLCFHQKRKTLRNNLKDRYEPERVESIAGAKARAEELSVEQLIELYRKLESEQ